QTSNFLQSGLYLPNLVVTEEKYDGTKVLVRSDMDYDQYTGQLSHRIDRAHPSPFGTPHDMTQYPGDIKTTYRYSLASGNVVEKDLTSSPTDPGYAIKYTYGPALGTCVGRATTVGEVATDVCGGYLSSKAFLNGGVTSWKAIDRQRDANTGVVL